MDELLALLKKLPFHAKFGFLQIPRLASFGVNFLLAFAAHLLRQQHPLRTVGHLQALDRIQFHLNFNLPIHGHLVQLSLGIRVLRQMQQNVVGIDVRELLRIRMVPHHQGQAQHYTRYSSHLHLIFNYKSPIFMPMLKWNCPRDMFGIVGTSSKRHP